MRRWILVSALLCASSCTQVTQTTVVIEADDDIVEAAPTVTVQVFRPDETMALEEIPTSMATNIRLAIVPLGGDTTRTYRVVATARTPETPPRVWTTRAISGFVPGQRRELHLRLQSRCLNVDCPDTQVCRAGTCEPLIAQETTPVGAGNDSGTLRPDAAVPPGTDAGSVERCPWQVDPPITTENDVPVAPWVSVDRGSVFIAFTSEGRSDVSRGVQMVRRVGSGWSTPEVLVPMSDPGEPRLFSFRVDSGTWRIATVDSVVPHAKWVRIQGGDVHRLPDGVNTGFFPQMGLSAGVPRFLTTSSATSSAIWTPAEIRPIPGVAADGYAPNGADDSVVSDGMLYRYRGGSWMGPLALHSSRDTTTALLSEPDGTLHIIYTAGTSTMHRSVGSDGALGVPTPIVARPGFDLRMSAARPSAPYMFYWGGRLWNSDGSMLDEVPIPSGWAPDPFGGSVIDEFGGLHLVARMNDGTGVQYAYRPPCP